MTDSPFARLLKLFVLALKLFVLAAVAFWAAYKLGYIDPVPKVIEHRMIRHYFSADVVHVTVRNTGRSGHIYVQITNGTSSKKGGTIWGDRAEYFEADEQREMEIPLVLDHGDSYAVFCWATITTKK